MRAVPATIAQQLSQTTATARRKIAQHEHLHPGGAAVAVDELREDRRQEDDRLRVGDADEEPLAEQPAARFGHGGRVEHAGERAAAADRLHAEVGQVGRTDQLERR